SAPGCGGWAATATPCFESAAPSTTGPSLKSSPTTPRRRLSRPLTTNEECTLIVQVDMGVDESRQHPHPFEGRLLLWYALPLMGSRAAASAPARPFFDVWTGW